MGIGGRTWPLLVLVVLVLALGFLVLRDGPSTDEARERARRLAPDFHAAHLQRFTVIRDGVAWRFERRPGSEPEGGWWLAQSPGKRPAHVGRADRQAVQELLATVEWAIVERRLGTVPPPESGLDPPRLEFVGGGLWISLGKSDPLGAGIYAQVEEVSAAEAAGLSGESGHREGQKEGRREGYRDGHPAGGEVVVTDPHLGQLLEADTSPETFRETSLLAAPVRDAHVIEIRSGAGTASPPVRLERRGARWDLMTPAPTRSDAVRVEELLKALTDTRAARFLAAVPAEAQADDSGPRPGADPGPGSVADPGIGPPLGDTRRGTVVILDGRVRAHVLGPCGRQGEPDEQAVMRWDGAVACFAAKALDPLFREPRTLRELRPWPLPANEVVSLTLRQGAKSLTLERSAYDPSDPSDPRDPRGDLHDGWQMRSGDGTPMPADDEAVHQWLTALAAVHGAPSPPEARPSGDPGFRAMARSTSGETFTLSVVGRGGGGWWVVRNTEEEPLLVGEDLSPFLTVAPRVFRPRRVLSLRESELVRLVIDDHGDGAILERSGANVTATWHLVAPQGRGKGTGTGRPGDKPGALIDTARLDRLLLRLGELRARQFLPRAASDAEILDHPARRLRIETAGAPPLELRVAAPRTESDDCRAILDDQPDTLLLPTEVCTDLLAPLVTPDPPTR